MALLFLQEDTKIWGICVFRTAMQLSVTNRMEVVASMLHRQFCLIFQGKLGKAAGGTQLMYAKNYSSEISTGKHFLQIYCLKVEHEATMRILTWLEGKALGKIKLLDEKYRTSLFKKFERMGFMHTVVDEPFLDDDLFMCDDMFLDDDLFICNDLIKGFIFNPYSSDQNSKPEEYFDVMLNPDTTYYVRVGKELVEWFFDLFHEEEDAFQEASHFIIGIRCKEEDYSEADEFIFRAMIKYKRVGNEPEVIMIRNNQKDGIYGSFFVAAMK